MATKKQKFRLYFKVTYDVVLDGIVAETFEEAVERGRKFKPNDLFKPSPRTELNDWDIKFEGVFADND